MKSSSIIRYTKLIYKGRVNSMRYPRFIDNQRKNLSETLKMIAPNHDVLSIATGYWDVAGTLQIIYEINDYKKVRLLIGKEPIAHRYQTKYKIDLEQPENLFPDADFKHDLENDSKSENVNDLRNTVSLMSKMIEDGVLEVKIFRNPRLHAKAYIFGENGNGNSVGIIGSSNFTKAGLTSNTELNYLEDDYQRVEFIPSSENQQNGHIMWFDNLWESEESVEWTGEFEQILNYSPLGNNTYGSYDVYIKTLMEIFPEELIEPGPFDDYIEDYLHPFQNQNALSLRRKLQVNGVAMLSDSVGLGKTITTAAIIDQYIKQDKDNITLILPASLQNQWIEELESKPFNLKFGKDFKIFTQENINKLNIETEKMKTSKDDKIDDDLVVIDEAHNLRNVNSKRYDAALNYLQSNLTSEVLLLTATPINNSLMDFASQIQLGSKGELSSYQVKYKSSPGARSERIDFFQAVKQIESAANRAHNKGAVFDWEFHKPTLVSGLRHYLVRSTRQGVEKRQAMRNLDGVGNSFPETIVEQISYRYSENERKIIDDNIDSYIDTAFEKIDPRKLNLELIMDITQRTEHPLDIVNKVNILQNKTQNVLLQENYNISKSTSRQPILSNEKNKSTVITTLYKLINLLGFVPYKADTYARSFHGEPMSKINNILDNTDEQSISFRMQFSMHNMLHTTWLKRLESSTATLLKSVNYYLKKLDNFDEWVKKGYILNISDIETLSSEYNNDAQLAEEAYRIYREKLIEANKKGEEDLVKKQGVEIKKINSEDYNIKQLKIDIERDRKIVYVLISILESLSSSEHDAKLNTLTTNLINIIKKKKHGEKVLVFSFFADTINYLKEVLPKMIGSGIPEFSRRAKFISGQSNDNKKVAQLFSPKSQKYNIKKEENEIDFLFSTDILSEGQNLQDAGILLNYDLHWNPVRMIQRNGRINRLGSNFDKVLIANARPHDELDEYLKLVTKLENKINAINSTIGTDSSIIGEEINPIEFSDNIDEAYGIYSMDTEKASKSMYEIEKEDNIIDWIDDYSMELRDFLDDNNKEEIDRILNIPLGKWNYLPKNDENINIFGLFRGKGINISTGGTVSNTVFVKYQKTKGDNIFAAKQGVKTEIISDEEVLKYIKTTPKDNQPLLDTIDVDRGNYVKLGTEESTVNFNNNSSIFDIKPRHFKALKYLQNYLPEFSDIQGLIQNNIKKVNEEKQFNYLCRKVNSDIKKHGKINLSTVNKTRKLFESLYNKNDHLRKLEDVEGVLFYAPTKQNK